MTPAPHEHDTGRPTRRRWPKILGAAAVAGLAAFALSLAWRPVASAVALERGRAAEGRYELRAAADLLAAAAEADPANPTLAFESARLARRLGDFADRPELFEPALTRAARLGADPEDVRRQRVLAAAAVGQFHGPDGVWDELPKLLEDDRGQFADICAAYVDGLCVLHRFAEAGHLLDAWERKAPGDPDIAYRRGVIAEFRSEAPEAVAHYRAVLDAAPWRADAAVHLAGLLRKGVTQDPEAAAAALEPFADHSDNPALLVEYGRTLLTLDRPAEALEPLRRAVSLRPDDLDLLPPLAEAQLAAGDAAGAVETVAPLLAAWPQDLDALTVRARALRDLGDADEADAAFARLNAAKEAEGPLYELVRLSRAGADADADAFYELGRLVLDHHDRGDGIDYLSVAVRLDPTHGPAHAVLARAYEATGRRDLARHHRRLAARHSGAAAGD